MKVSFIYYKWLKCCCSCCSRLKCGCSCDVVIGRIILEYILENCE